MDCCSLLERQRCKPPPVAVRAAASHSLQTASSRDAAITSPPSQPPKARKRAAPAANNDARISHCFNGPGPCRRPDELSMMPRFPWQLKRSEWAGPRARPCKTGGREGLVSVDSSRHGRERGSEAKKRRDEQESRAWCQGRTRSGLTTRQRYQLFLSVFTKQRAGGRDLCKPAASPPAPKLILFFVDSPFSSLLHLHPTLCCSRRSRWSTGYPPWLLDSKPIWRSLKA